MQRLNALKASALRVAALPDQASLNYNIKRFRKNIYCNTCLQPVDRRPCFDIRNVSIERARRGHSSQIRTFLNTHYWTREPSVVGLWMNQNSSYLETLTDKYSHSGDRLLALEKIKRTGEKKLIGLTVAYKVFPWMIDELEEWAHYTMSRPERYRMYFCAHCLKSPNLFKKYNVDYIYDIQVLGTAAEVTGQGVGTLLLKHALMSAEEMRHTVVQVVSVSKYTSKICERCGMKREWSMDYSDFVDDAGQRVFFPRRPHHTVGLYVKYFNPKLGGKMPCKPQL